MTPTTERSTIDLLRAQRLDDDDPDAADLTTPAGLDDAALARFAHDVLAGDLHCPTIDGLPTPTDTWFLCSALVRREKRAAISRKAAQAGGSWWRAIQDTARLAHARRVLADHLWEEVGEWD